MLVAIVLVLTCRRVFVIRALIARVILRQWRLSIPVPCGVHGRSTKGRCAPRQKDDDKGPHKGSEDAAVRM